MTIIYCRYYLEQRLVKINKKLFLNSVPSATQKFSKYLHNIKYIYIYILKLLADTSPFLGPLVTFPLGFKARVGSALFAFCGGECNIHSPRSTSGATHADLLVAGIAASPVPTYCCRGEVARIRTGALRISVNIRYLSEVPGGPELKFLQSRDIVFLHLPSFGYETYQRSCSVHGNMEYPVQE